MLTQDYAAMSLYAVRRAPKRRPHDGAAVGLNAAERRRQRRKNRKKRLAQERDGFAKK